MGHHTEGLLTLQNLTGDAGENVKPKKTYKAVCTSGPAAPLSLDITNSISPLTTPSAPSASANFSDFSALGEGVLRQQAENAGWKIQLDMN